jgi:hypothetical protein
MQSVEERPEPLQLAFALIWLAYTGILVFALSGVTGWWSGMHSLGFAGLLFLGMPTMLIQAGILWRVRAASARHRLAFYLSAAFPLALATFIAVVLLLSGFE